MTFVLERTATTPTTTHFDIAQKIINHFANNWSATGIRRPNVDFDPRGLTAWVGIEVVPADSARLTITGDDHTGIQHKGLCVVNIYIKPNTYIGLAREYVDDVRDIFEYLAIIVSGSNKIKFYVPVPRQIGSTTLNRVKWWQEQVRTPWEYLTN